MMASMATMSIVLSVACVLLVLGAAWSLAQLLPAGWDRWGVLPYVLAFAKFAWLPTLLGALMGAGVALAMVLQGGALEFASIGLTEAGFYAPWWITGGACMLLAAQAWLRQRLIEQTYGAYDDADTHADADIAGIDSADSVDSAAASIATSSKSSDIEAISASPQARKTPTLKIMTLNCRLGKADAAQIVATVRAERIDALALQEVNVQLLSALKRQGLSDVLPYAALGEQRAGDNGGGNALYARVEPRGIASVRAIPAAALAAMHLALPTAHASGAARRVKSVLLICAHPKSPMRSKVDWSQGIMALAAAPRAAQQAMQSINAPHDDAALRIDVAMHGDIARRNDGVAYSDNAGAAPHAIMLGDYNALVSHPSFRWLLRQGWHHASAEPLATFPSWTRQLAQRLVPRWLPQTLGRHLVAGLTKLLNTAQMDLDHILLPEGIAAHDVHTLPIAGSDHKALIATLTWRS